MKNTTLERIEMNSIPAEAKSARVENEIATRKVFKLMGGAGVYVFVSGDDVSETQSYEAYCDDADSFNNNYRHFSHFGIDSIIKK